MILALVFIIAFLALKACEPVASTRVSGATIEGQRFEATDANGVKSVMFFDHRLTDVEIAQIARRHHAIITRMS